MPDDDELERFEVGDILIWNVTGPAPDAAEARAVAFEARALRYKLGECGKSPAGLGASWWFDLQLAKRADYVFIVALFGRMPDHVY